MPKLKNTIEKTKESSLDPSLTHASASTKNPFHKLFITKSEGTLVEAASKLTLETSNCGKKRERDPEDINPRPKKLAPMPSPENLPPKLVL